MDKIIDKTLTKPPIIMALFQMLFDNDAISLSDYQQFDTQLCEILPNKANSLQSQVNIPGTTAIGISKVDANTKLVGYTYFSEDNKVKLGLQPNGITLTDERIPYQGWDNCISKVQQYLDILTPLLNNHVVSRISVRFINRFNFTLEEFDNPNNFFNTIIAVQNETSDFPVNAFGFRIVNQIPTDINDDIYSIVNHNAQKTLNNVLYFFDIDVLERVNFNYNQSIILEKLAGLREIKNKLFFDNITEKTLLLCN
jgi:uncharacterized protein (TIGR04255 family)